MDRRQGGGNPCHGQVCQVRLGQHGHLRRRPRGRVSAGSLSAENRATVGTPRAAARWVGPVSLPTASAAPARVCASCSRVVRPVRSTACGHAARMAAACRHRRRCRRRCTGPAASRPPARRTVALASACGGGAGRRRGPARERRRGTRRRLPPRQPARGRARGTASTPAIASCSRCRSSVCIAFARGLACGKAQPRAMPDQAGRPARRKYQPDRPEVCRSYTGRSRAAPAAAAAAPARATAAAAVHHHPVEPGCGARERGERRRGQQRDVRRRMRRADGGERAERQHEVAQRAELDDEDAAHASSSRYTSSVACCIAAVV